MVGGVFQIDPPLTNEITPYEFQKHYDTATNIVESIQSAKDNSTDIKEVGCRGDERKSNMYYIFRVFWLKCPFCLHEHVFMEEIGTGTAECLGCGRYVSND